MHLFTHLCIRPCMNPFTYKFINMCIHLLNIHPFTQPVICHLMYLSIQATSCPTLLLIYSSIHLISKRICQQSLLTDIKHTTALRRMRTRVKSIEQFFFTSAMNNHKLLHLNGTKWIKMSHISPPAATAVIY